MTATGEARVPMFPLGTVLFPGGALPLRVFESRYVDMVRDCMRDDQPFGVLRITRGQEVGQPAEHESIGCLARIVDWDMEQAGVLKIATRGTRRFRVVEHSVARNGLITAHIVQMAEDPIASVPDEMADCTALLARIVADLEAKHTNPLERPIAQPYDYDSCSWVGNRLCELLPIPTAAKQKLMELVEPEVRLSLVRQFLVQQKVL